MIVLESLEFPDPVIHVAVEPKTKADQDKMSKALFALSEEDPTFQVRTDEETAQTVISGMGELHLEVLVDRMMREFKVDATVGKPQVAYRETITDDGHELHLHRTRSRRVARASTPRSSINMETTGPRWRLRVRGQDLRRPHPQGVHPLGRRTASREAMTNGVLAGFPMVDIKVELRRRQVPRRRLVRDGVQDRRHPWRFKEAARKAGPVLLEPIMAVEVVTPEDYMGDVIGDLNSRRGKVGKMEQRGNNQVVDAEVPLSEMFGYSTDLRSKTQGRATYTMQFASYQQTPQERAGRDRRPGHRAVTDGPQPVPSHTVNAHTTRSPRTQR